MTTPPPLPYAPGPAPEQKPKGLPSGALGRPAGAANKVTRALKEAILYAAAEAGDRHAKYALEEKGETIEGGLTGYLVVVATTDPKTFCGLLGRVLPMTVSGEDGGAITVQIVKRTYD